jgi:hypothetical protein
MLLMNPLNWGRYYLPLLPFMVLFVGIGLQSLLTFVRQPVEKSLVDAQQTV